MSIRLLNFPLHCSLIAVQSLWSQQRRVAHYWGIPDEMQRTAEVNLNERISECHFGQSQDLNYSWIIQGVPWKNTESKVLASLFSLGHQGQHRATAPSLYLFSNDTDDSCLWGQTSTECENSSADLHQKHFNLKPEYSLALMFFHLHAAVSVWEIRIN